MDRSLRKTRMHEARVQLGLSVYRYVAARAYLPLHLLHPPPVLRRSTSCDQVQRAGYVTQGEGGGRLARVSAVDLSRSPVSLTCSSNRDCPLLFPAIVTRRSLKQLFYTFVCHLSGNDTRGSQDQPAVDDCTKLLFNRAHSKAEIDAVPDKDKDNVRMNRMYSTTF